MRRGRTENHSPPMTRKFIIVTVMSLVDRIP